MLLHLGIFAGGGCYIHIEEICLYANFNFSPPVKCDQVQQVA